MALPQRPNKKGPVTPPVAQPTLPYTPPSPVAPAPRPVPEEVEYDTVNWGSTAGEEDTVSIVDGDEDFNYGEQEPVREETRSVFDDPEEEEAEEENELEQELLAYPDDVVESIELLMEEILSDESSEVIMNGPDSIHRKVKGRREHLTGINFHDVKTYHNVIDKFILEYTNTHNRIANTQNLIEGQLQIEDIDDPSNPPTTARVHIVAPPAVEFAKVTIAKKAKRQLTLEDLLARRSFGRQEYEFLKAISRGKLTTVISGVSGSGKTTLLEAMSHYFDQNDRVVIVEDTPELKFPVPDAVYMVSSKVTPGGKATDAITLQWLVEQTNRMRPDRIIIGETRGAEMSEFLIAANSGADGSMTTIHAYDPRKALDKMARLVMKAGGSQDESSINKDIATTVHIIIQTALIDGKHRITHIEEISNVVRRESGQIATTTLFRYDRRTDTSGPVGRPSEELKDFLASRNVQIDPRWFQTQHQ